MQYGSSGTDLWTEGLDGEGSVKFLPTATDATVHTWAKTRQKTACVVDLSDCSLITDAAIIERGTGLAYFCPNLTKVNLSRCHLITDVAITNEIFPMDHNVQGTGLADLCSERLTEVNLRNCSNLTDVAVEGLKKCKNLRTMYLNGCTKITKEPFTQRVFRKKDIFPGLLTIGITIGIGNTFSVKFLRKHINGNVVIDTT